MNWHPRYGGLTTMPLRRLSADTAMIASAALAGLHMPYRPGYQFIKAGVILLELQEELYLQADEVPGRSWLMTAMDALNQRATAEAPCSWPASVGPEP